MIAEAGPRVVPTEPHWEAGRLCLRCLEASTALSHYPETEVVWA